MCDAHVFILVVLSFQTTVFVFGFEVRVAQLELLGRTTLRSALPSSALCSLGLLETVLDQFNQDIVLHPIWRLRASEDVVDHIVNEVVVNVVVKRNNRLAQLHKVKDALFIVVLTLQVVDERLLVSSQTLDDKSLALLMGKVVLFIVLVAVVILVEFVVADKLLQGLEDFLLISLCVLVVHDLLLALGLHEVTSEKLALLGRNAESIKAALKRNNRDLLLGHEWLKEERHNVAWRKVLFLKP